MRIYYNAPVDYLRGEIEYNDKTIKVYKIPNESSYSNKVDALSLVLQDDKDFEYSFPMSIWNI